MTPFSLIKPKNPLPLVFDSPHSGQVYPEDCHYACTFDDLEKCEDKFVDELFSNAPNLGAAILCANFPRSFIDVNRKATDIDPELMREDWPHSEIAPSARSDAGIGLIRRLVKPGVPVYDGALTAQEVWSRIQKYYDPYHEALSNIIYDAHYNFGQVWHVNCHSMPSSSARPRRVIGQAGRASDIVLGDRDGTTCHLGFTHALRDFMKDLGYVVTINDPFKGVELISRYSNPGRGFNSIQIEINKSLYMDERNNQKNENYAALKADIEKLMTFCADFVQAELVDLAAD